MKNFTYRIPTTIHFGEGQIKQLAKEIKKYTSRVLLIYGKNSIKKIGLYDQVIEILNKNEIFFREVSGILPNPDVSSVREAVNVMRENELDFILAVGGGSVIDCAKAVSASVYYEGDAWDFPSRKAQIGKVCKVGTILTLSATGSEMNGGAVISNRELGQKLPMGHPSLRPVFSILDPTYTFSVSKFQTAAGIVDTLSHLFEQYFSTTKMTLVQDNMTLGLMKVCIEIGEKLLENPFDYDLRANAMWASTMALNNMLSYGKDTDWAVHMIEHEVSAVCDVTHGAGLAILTPHWMRFVQNKTMMEKISKYARDVWGLKAVNESDIAEEAILKTEQFFKRLKLPSTLKEVGIEEASLPNMAKNIVQFGAIGNIAKLEEKDVLTILKNAF